MLNLSKLSLGIVETVGLAAAIEAADAAVKSANVNLIGYELTKGGGMVTIKLSGDVGAVKAAVDAACIAAAKVGSVYSRQVIARPHEEIEKLIRTKETVGLEEKKEEVVKAEEILTEETSMEEEEEIPEEETFEEKKEISEVITEDEAELVREGELEEVQEVQEETTEDEKKNEEMIEGLITRHQSEFEEEKTPEEVCNFCKDPQCPRKKGELRNTCIHYDELLDQ